MPDAAVKSLTKALRIMESLCNSADPLGSAELSRIHKLNLRNVIRLLGTLEQEGFVTKLPSGKYQVSPRLVIMTARWSHITPAAAVTREVLTRLRDLTGETAFVMLRSGYMRTAADSVQSTQVLRSNVEAGFSAPLLTGSTGYALLADARPREIAEVRAAMVERFQVQDALLTPEEEARLLEDFRVRGYGSRGTEIERILAVPIRHADLGTVAALGVSGPTPRWTEERIQQSLEQILREAGTLADAMTPAARKNGAGLRDG